MKSRKPPEHHAFPNMEISIVAVRTIHHKSALDQGSFSYPKFHPTIIREEHAVGTGRYVGSGKNITAFIWLDDEIRDPRGQ